MELGHSSLNARVGSEKHNVPRAAKMPNEAIQRTLLVTCMMNRRFEPFLVRIHSFPAIRVAVSRVHCEPRALCPCSRINGLWLHLSSTRFSSCAPRPWQIKPLWLPNSRGNQAAHRSGRQRSLVWSAPPASTDLIGQSNSTWPILLVDKTITYNIKKGWFLRDLLFLSLLFIFNE